MTKTTAALVPAFAAKDNLIYTSQPTTHAKVSPQESKYVADGHEEYKEGASMLSLLSGNGVESAAFTGGGMA